METVTGPTTNESTAGATASQPQAEQSPQLEDQGVPVGEMWCAVRRRLGWTLELAAKRLGITPNHLDELEAGFRELTPGMAGELGEVYGVEPERLERRPWSERIPPRFDSETQTLWMGWLPIEIRYPGNEALLMAIADAIRTMRFLGEQQPVHLRETELEVLVPLFDLTDGQLDERLGRIFKLDQAGVLRVLNAIIAVVEKTRVDEATD